VVVVVVVRLNSRFCAPLAREGRITVSGQTQRAARVV
jgi:hypothetical protein